MPRQYVDNAYNRSIGRVGMTVGTAVVSRSSGGHGSASSYYAGSSSSSSSTKVYVDNSQNRNLGRVGLPHGTAVHSRSDSGHINSSSTGSYVDNTQNRSLGRVGLPHGSAVHSKSGSTASSSSSVYVDNALNRSLGRVGQPLGSAIHSKGSQSSYSSPSFYVDNELNRRLERVGVCSKSENTAGAMARTYVDNAYNRQLGRVGLPIGTAVHSKASVKSALTGVAIKVYVDNALNRQLGRVGKQLGSMPVSNTKCPKKINFNFNCNPNENEKLQEILNTLMGAQREEFENLIKLNQARNDILPAANRFDLKSEQVISFEDLVVGDKIGSGGFGDVHVATWKGHQVAVKKLRVQRVSQLKRKQFQDEVQSIANLDFPYIVKFYGACIETPNLAIVMEFLCDGSLYDNLHYNEVQFDDKTKNQFICDVSSALEYIHSLNMVHRDIKSKNLMLCNDRTHCKLADFGLALRDDTETNASGMDHGFAGTEKYCPKELIEGQQLKVEQLKCVDIYSLAITIVELLTEVEPFDGYNLHQIRRAIKEGKTPPMENFGISEEKQGLLKEALSQSAIDRPKAGEFLNKFKKIIAAEI